jgi:homoserine kinase type II
LAADEEGMAVYTPLDDSTLAAFLARYPLGEARTFKGITEGVENSNWFLGTTTGRYILTVFEKRVRADDLPFFLTLKGRLAARGFPCPLPVQARDGSVLQTLAGKPAVIVTFLDGLSPQTPDVAQCAAAGATLARLHTCLAPADSAGLTRPNDLSASAWPGLWAGQAATAEALAPGLSALIEADLAQIATHWPPPGSLPEGLIHADMFPDNTLFVGGELSGVIDFYFACRDAYAYDLAVCLNAWAFKPDGQFCPDRGAAMLDAYTRLRPLSEAEQAALPTLCRGAALRFFLTRLVDWTATPAGAQVRRKDPLEYATRLTFHRQAADAHAYGLPA